MSNYFGGASLVSWLVQGSGGVYFYFQTSALFAIPSWPTMWGYRYIDLTAEQKIARRSSLDWAGYQVILSQFAVATALSLYIWLSPGHAHSRTAAERLLRRLAWRLSGPTSLRHPELRCLGDWIVVVAWMSWCTFLSVAGSGNGKALDSTFTVARANWLQTISTSRRLLGSSRQQTSRCTLCLP